MREMKNRAALVLSATALVVAIGGSGLAAMAAIPQEGRFTACYQTSDSLLNRIVLLAEPNEGCPDTYARVSWPQSGGAGPTGPPGPQGLAGPQGPQGPRGPSGAAANSGTLIVSATERRITLTAGRDAIARCPKGGRAVGGGGVIHNSGYEAKSSYPLIEKRVPIGWAFEPHKTPRYGFKAVDGGLKETFLSAAHRHKFSSPPQLVPLESRGAPPEVTVYAICLRSYSVAKPKPNKPPERKP
jgi:hypothetical protein